jgi:hypothetical protein
MAEQSRGRDAEDREHDANAGAAEDHLQDDGMQRSEPEPEHRAALRWTWQ